jgi:ABC-type transport system involved in multi-copper enzyme maturation permease subunit
MSLITRLTPDNPVLTKELRIRMRGARAYWILLGYLGFLSLITLFQYGSWAQNTVIMGASESSKFGAELFQWLLVTQVFLVLFITPAVTSGAITIEREQQTIDLLTLTRMSRGAIIAGKLLSAVAFTALLVVSSIPLVSICFMLGSVDPGMMLSIYFMMLTASFLIGGLGLMWSSIARTTTQAVMCTYSTLFVLFVVCSMAFGLNLAPVMTSSLMENMFHAVGNVLFGGSFLGMQAPDGTGFCVFAIIGGILFAAVAMSRMEMWPERRGPLLRGLCMLAIGVELLSLNLWWLQAWYQRGAKANIVVTQAPVGVLTFAGLILMLLIPIFATGEVAPEDCRTFGRYMAHGWTRKGVGRGRLSSAIPFLLVLTTACLALYFVSFVIVGHPGDVIKSGATVATKLGSVITTPVPAPTTAVVVQAKPGTVTAPGATTFAGGTPGALVLDPSYARSGDLPQATAVLYIFTVGFALFCIALSLLMRNRWAAWLVAYAFLILCLIVPEVARGSILAGNGPNISVWLYCLSPLQALAQMADPAHYYLSDIMRNGALPLKGIPMWYVCSIAWTVIGAISACLILYSVRRNSKSASAQPTAVAA